VRLECATALVLLFLASAAVSEPIAPAAIEVTDGDTFEARGHTYRLVGCDTPEFWSRNRKVLLPEKRLALLAAERLHQLVSAGGITLSEVRCSCPESKIGTSKCNYGRKCAILAVGGKDVCETLIAEGHARPYHCSKTKCPPTRPWP
jgi:endonuclease YncB( thermonuclease family)